MAVVPQANLQVAQVKKFETNGKPTFDDNTESKEHSRYKEDLKGHMISSVNQPGNIQGNTKANQTSLEKAKKRNQCSAL